MYRYHFFRSIEWGITGSVTCRGLWGARCVHFQDKNTRYYDTVSNLNILVSVRIVRAV
jgi:hypothetical protein